MTDFTRSYEVEIDASVHDVFEYCRDPRHVFEGWPELKVTDVSMTPDGVGTTAHIEAKFLKGMVVEQIEREYTEVVPDQRIVSKAHAKVRFAGRTNDVNAPIFTLLFEAEDAGTKLTLALLEKDISWLENLYDSVSGGPIEKHMRSMLAAIKTGVERRAPRETRRLGIKAGAEGRPAAARETASGPPAAGQRFAPGNVSGEMMFQLLNLHTGALTQRFGSATAAVMRREMLQEYRALVPGLPDIGGRSNPESMSMVLAPWALALYRVVRRHGGSAEDAGEVIHYGVQKLYGHIPPPMRRSMGRSSTKERAQAKVRWFAENHYPDNWVYEFVDGDGQDFDFGLDVTQCALVNYLHAQGADELTPYLCDLDYVTFAALGVGLTRTKTLAWGCDRCDFRVTNPGRTTSTWPPSFQERACGVLEHQ